jgi:hypothetical protein
MNIEESDIGCLIDLDELMNELELAPRIAEGSLTESSVSDVDTQSDHASVAGNDSSDELQEDETTSQSPSSSNSRRVQFGFIEIREYERIVGDHPDVKVGPPMGIGWQYYQNDKQSIETYESTRVPKKYVLRMSSITRKNMLRNIFNIPEYEIRSAEKEVQKIQKLRIRSSQQSHVVAKVEDTIRRPFRRFTTSFSSEMIFKSFAMATPMGGMQY